MIKLRKKTGYSFVNCRKALLKFGENNLSDVEKYLHEMAIKEGWAKAAKYIYVFWIKNKYFCYILLSSYDLNFRVSSRQTSQGQCGIVADGNLAAVVELKCETDFVAKSVFFKQLVLNFQ